MNSRSFIQAAVIAALALGFARPSIAGSTPLGSALTYQGVLTDGGSPANGNFHLRFQLFDALAGGAQVGANVNAPAVAVNDGLFTVPIDFGVVAFDGSARWLQVSVITNGGATVTTLVPRQAITVAPYSLQTRGIFVDDAGDVGLGTTTPQVDLHIAGNFAILRLEDTTTPGGGFTTIYDAQPTQLRFSKTNFSGSVFFDLNPNPADGVNNGLVRLFRETNTNGAKRLDLCRGNNTSQLSASIGVDGGDSFFQAHGGNVGIGTTTPQVGLHVVDASISVPAILGVNGDDGIGVQGEGGQTGVKGFSDSGSGVFGIATDDNAFASSGVTGHSFSPNGFDFFATGAGVNFGAPSSIRWKRNIEPIDDPLGKLAEMRGVSFDWDAEHGGQHDIGFIGEEVGAVLPEIVNYEDNGIDAIGMDYSKLTPLLVEAIKSLRAEKDAQMEELRSEKDAQIAALQHDHQQLQDRLAALEAVVAQLNDRKENH